MRLRQLESCSLRQMSVVQVSGYGNPSRNLSFLRL